MKKIIIITIVIVLVTILGFLIFKQKNTSEDTTTTGVVKPNIPNYIEYKGEPKVDFEKSSFDFPSKLPLLKITKSGGIDQTEALKIAENHGFDENFSTFDDSEFGKTYLWNKGGVGSLIVYSKSSNVVFTPTANNSSVSFKKDFNSIKDTAINYVKSKNLIDTNEKIIANIYGLSSDDESSNIVSIEKAEIFKVVLSLNINGYSIITTNPYQSHFSIYINKTGSIFKIEYSYKPLISRTDQEYSIKNYEDFIKSVNEAKIVSINDGKILPQDIKNEDIENIKIKNIKISYLEDSYKTELLQPIFVLESEITLKNINYSSILYLPAFK